MRNEKGFYVPKEGSWLEGLWNLGARTKSWMNEGGNIGREDTVMQRSVQDYENAGLAPQFLAGKAPSAGSSAKPGVGLDSALKVASLFSEKANTLQTLADTAQVIMSGIVQGKTLKSNITATQEENIQREWNAKLDEAKNSMLIQALREMDRLYKETGDFRYNPEFSEILAKKVILEKGEWNLEWYQNAGLPVDVNLDQWTKLGGALLNATKDVIEGIREKKRFESD